MRPSVPSDGNQVIVDAKNKTTLKKHLVLFLECCRIVFLYIVHEKRKNPNETRKQRKKG